MHILNPGSVVCDAFRLMKRAWLPLAALMILGIALTLGVQYLIGGEDLVFGETEYLTTNQIVGWITAVTLVSLWWGLFYLQVVDRAYTGDTGKSFGAMMATAFAKVPWLLIAYVLAILGIALGLVLLVVPGILLILRWSYLFQTVALESNGPIAALKRSAAISKGNRINTFALWAAVLGMMYLILVPIFIAFTVMAAAAVEAGQTASFDGTTGGLVLFGILLLVEVVVGIYFYCVMVTAYRTLAPHSAAQLES